MHQNPVLGWFFGQSTYLLYLPKLSHCRLWSPADLKGHRCCIPDLHQQTFHLAAAVAPWESPVGLGRELWTRDLPLLPVLFWKSRTKSQGGWLKEEAMLCTYLGASLWDCWMGLHRIGRHSSPPMQTYLGVSPTEFLFLMGLILNPVIAFQGNVQTSSEIKPHKLYHQTNNGNNV